MEKPTRRRYTLECEQEAVRLVASGQKAAAKAVGIVEQTLANWVKADTAGRSRGLSSEQAGAERMELNRLRAELARVTMERDILHPANEDLFAGAPVREKPRRASRRRSDEVRLDRAEQAAVAGARAVPDAGRERLGIASAPGAEEEDSQALDWLLWHNGSRMHSTLNYLSPTQFEQQAIAQRHALAA